MRTKKKVLVVALIVSLIAIISLGSLAWFTAKDDVTNTVRLSNKFDVDVYETDPETQQPTAVGHDSEGVTYKDIMPGQVIAKDPTVKNTCEHDQWVRVKVTVSDYAIWSTIVTEGTDLTTIFGEFSPDKWARIDDPEVDAAADTITYTFYMNEVLHGGQEQKLFESVKIPGALTFDQAQAMNEFTIKVAVEAIQAEFLPDGVDTAPEAFALLAG